MSRVTLKIVSQSLLGSDPTARAEEVRVSVQNASTSPTAGYRFAPAHRHTQSRPLSQPAFRMKERAPLPGSKRFMQSVGSWTMLSGGSSRTGGAAMTTETTFLAPS
jgi:hypothetical protein